MVLFLVVVFLFLDCFRSDYIKNPFNTYSQLFIDDIKIHVHVYRYRDIYRNKSMLISFFIASQQREKLPNKKKTISRS